MTGMNYYGEVCDLIGLYVQNILVARHLDSPPYTMIGSDLVLQNSRDEGGGRGGGGVGCCYRILDSIGIT